MQLVVCCRRKEVKPESECTERGGKRVGIFGHDPRLEGGVSGARIYAGKDGRDTG